MCVNVKGTRSDIRFAPVRSNKEILFDASLIGRTYFPNQLREWMFLNRAEDIDNVIFLRVCDRRRSFLSSSRAREFYTLSEPSMKGKVKHLFREVSERA
jgi:hypothetical protein